MIKFGHPSVNFHFPVGGVEMHFSLGFNRFYLKDVFSPLVKQPDQLGIDTVDIAADVFKIGFFVFHGQNLGGIL